PNTSRIAAVPNMSAKMPESSAPIAIWITILRCCSSPFRGAFEVGPNPASQALERRKTGLVRHLRALGDPITEIDKRLPLALALLDEPEDAPDPEAAFR